jgi:hypothetical protein
MESFSSLFNKIHRSELVLVILFIVYLVLGLNTPEPVAGLVDSLAGKVIIILVVIYLFMHANPILAVLGLFVAFDLMRRSSLSTGIAALQQYAPSEIKKSSQFTAFNQFPYTLEQEVVAKMAPISKSGYSINQASYKPLLDNTHEAASIVGSN